jgi:hypothetical protein
LLPGSETRFLEVNIRILSVPVYCALAVRDSLSARQAKLGFRSEGVGLLRRAARNRWDSSRTCILRGRWSTILRGRNTQVPSSLCFHLCPWDVRAMVLIRTTLRLPQSLRDPSSEGGFAVLPPKMAACPRMLPTADATRRKPHGPAAGRRVGMRGPGPMAVAVDAAAGRARARGLQVWTAHNPSTNHCRPIPLTLQVVTRPSPELGFYRSASGPGAR